MSTYTDKFFADKAVGALWDVAVSIKRGNPLPLDKDSVVHGLTELNAIATGSVSYPGQIIAVVEDAVYEGEGEDKVLVTEESVTLYYLDHNKTPREVGKVPTGDSKTIEVSAEGAISLLGSASAQDGTLPMLENGALVWKTLEDIGAGDGNDNTTYEFSFADEKITIKPLFNGQPIKAEEGEKADVEGNLIVELDLSTFVTNDELTTALASYTKTDELPSKVSDFENDAGYLVANDLNDYAKSADVVDKTSYAEDKKALEDADAALDTAVKAAQKTADDATTAINDFLTGTGAEDVIDSLLDIKNALDDLVDPSELATSIASKADKVENATEGNFAGLDANGNLVDSGKKASDFATAAQGAIAENLDGTVATLSEEIDELQAQVQFGELTKDWAAENPEDVFTVEDAVLVGKELTLAEVADNYATKTELETLEGYVGTIPNDENGEPKADNVVEYIEVKAQEVLDAATGGSSESAASVKQQLDTYKAANDPKVKALLEEVWGSETSTGDSRIDTLVADLAQATATANAAIKEVKPATGAKITVNTADNVATIDDSALTTLITTAQNKADEAAGAAAANATAIQAANGKITNLENSINGAEGTDGLLTRMTNAEGKITTAEATIKSHGESITSLNGAVATKAEQSTLDAAVGDIAKNTSAITTLNETTIPGLETEISKKANSDSVYTKTEIDAKTGVLGDDKTIVALINEAQAAAEQKVTDLTNGAVKDNSDKLTTLIGSDTNKSVRNIAAEEINTIVGGVSDADTIEDIRSLIEYVNENGSSIQGINNEIDNLQILVGADSLGEGDSSLIARIGALESAGYITAADLGNGGAVGVSTDRLFNGSEELIFKAGNASGYNTEATE